MSWNLHNPRKGVYDFGKLGEDMSEFLDIRQFIQTAQEEDLFVILRPGPYICSEWEFGGMPRYVYNFFNGAFNFYYSVGVKLKLRIKMYT